MRSVRFGSAARRELRHALRYYREQAGDDVADRLLLEVENAVSKLERHAHSYSALGKDPSGAAIRRVRLRRFPYMLVYVIDGDDVVRVIACAHQRRDDYWRT